MVSFRKKSRKIFGMLLLACMVYMHGSCLQICATEAGQSSPEAYLKTFSCVPGTITPDFSPEVTGYMIAVADDVESVNVSCSLMSTSATIAEAKGFKNLEKGNNSAHITIKAPDGTTCTYNFNIIRGGASNGTGIPAASPGGAVGGFNFAVGGAQGMGLSVKLISEQPAVTPTAPAPTETQPPVTEPEQPEPTPAEPAEGENVQEPEPQPPENPDAEEGAPFEDTGEADAGMEPAVETMAPASGERYQIGGESIYANYYIRASFDESMLPAGFVLEPYNFEGATVQSAYFGAGNIRLVYAEAEDGNNGRLRLYYEDDKTVLDFVPFYQTNGYVFPVRYQAQIPVPQNYTGSYMPFEQEVVSCYIYTELTGNKLSVPEGMENKDTLQPGESTADADPVDVGDLDETPEFYLFYGMNGSGVESFYLYDWVEGTCQRYVERDTSYDLDQSYFKYKDMAHRRFAFMCALFVLLLIAVFFIINLFMKNRELKRDLEEENYEDEDAEEDSDEDSDEEDEDSDEDDIEIEELSDEEPYDDESYDEEAYEEESYEEESYEEEPEEDYADESDEEYTEDSGQESVWEDEEEYVYEEEPKKPTIGLTLSDFENSLQLESEEDEEAADEVDIEKKIIDHVEKTASDQNPESKGVRPTEFKMINLSRDPEPNGIDDDFEFEFIKFDDN